MQKIALITDSACDLSLSELEKYNIKLIPLKIIYSNKEFDDILEINSTTVYLNFKNEIPKTSLPSIKKVQSIIEEIKNEGYTHVISINISSNLSGTFNSIRLFLEDYENLTSYVFDSKALSRAEGSIVIQTAKLIKEGKSFEDIVKSLPKMREKIYGYFTLETLEYLKKGGRIDKVSGTIGELLNIKPIIRFNDEGIYETVAKVRGRKQSLNKLKKIIEYHINKNKCKIYILHGNCKDEADNFINSLNDFSNISSIESFQIGPALSVHTGPGLIGVIIEEI